MFFIDKACYPSLRWHNPDQVRGYHLSPHSWTPLDNSAAKVSNIIEIAKLLY